ncbi:hypothetical protein DFJ63DRAFT_336601 [Scheffersomyces coipomensis]|uniref:uncharacterized protein n=1 Tax=Scheffersomyces coipomensis TaxID=1788519 RepID=UPI00315C7017
MRQRISFSCTNCRKRKVKCDRKKPLCSACQRNRIPVHLCTYETSPHILKAAADNQIKLQQQLHLQQQHQLHLQQIQASQNSPSSDIDHSHDVTILSNSNSNVDTICSLRDFAYIKPNFETIAYFGATSWRTVLKESFRFHPIVVESSRKTYIDIKSWYKTSYQQELEADLPSHIGNLELLNDLLPSYKAMSKLLSNFLQQQDDLIFKCFSSTDIFKYFNNTFNRNGELNSNPSKVDICITLSIIILSCYINNEFEVDLTTLYQMIRYQFNNYKFQITVPSLQAMVLMYELKKYDYMGDYNATFVHDISLLCSITTTATSLGLNRDIEKIHKESDISHQISVRNLWKYILFEDAVRAFRYGHQLYLDDDYIEQQLLEDDEFNYKNRIEIMRNICRRLNSYTLSEKINLNSEIEFTKPLSKSDNFIDLALIQTLMQIRYVKFPTPFHFQHFFESSLALYKSSTKIVERGMTCHFLHAKETLFRAAYGILYILLDLIILKNCKDSEKIKQSQKEQSSTDTDKKPLGINLTLKGELITLDWFFKFFYDEHQPLLNKIRPYNEPIRYALISNVNILELLKAHLENEEGIKVEINGNYSKDTIEEGDDLYEFF